jgi:putative ABC transport system ATP-binding protein
MIEWQNVSKVFNWGVDNQAQVLRSCNLKVSEHEFVTLVGSSGSGKSTALYILGLLDQVSSGKYILMQQDVCEISTDVKASLRNKNFGFVFQQFMLLPKLTVYENVALPLYYSGSVEGDSAVKIALDQVGMGSYINYMPNQLSGGQQQRVAIARALVNKPAIILADEPTGSLDLENSQQVMQIFNEINQQMGTAIIMATHDLSWTKISHRTIQVIDGVIQG